MTKDILANKPKPESSFGYHDGEVETVISVDDVNRQAQELAETISKDIRNSQPYSGRTFFKN